MEHSTDSRVVGQAGLPGLLCGDFSAEAVP